MNEFLVLSATHVGAFVLGVVVAKNLIRWFREKFAVNPVGAIQAEIDNLKVQLDKLKGKS